MKKKYYIDFIYSFLGIAFFNAIIQIIVNPILEKQLGANVFGIVLSIQSLAGLMGATFGSATNYTRVVAQHENRKFNGDYNHFLFLVALITLPSSIIYLYYYQQFTVLNLILMILLLNVTVIRFYADSEFRLHIDYKKFFFFYLALGIGYLVGLILFFLTKQWFVVLVSGEILSLVYVYKKGNIFSSPRWNKSEYFKNTIRSIFILSLSYLIASVPVYADRLILQFFEGGEAVSTFYTASLGGKIVSLASTPLNGVIIGYIAKSRKKINRNFFLKYGIIAILGSILLAIVCAGFSMLFVYIFYKELFVKSIYLFFVLNLGQVLYFVSSTFMVVLLRYINEKFQIIINGIYFLVFILCMGIWIFYGNLILFAWAIVIANFLRLLIAAGFGFCVLYDNKR